MRPLGIRYCSLALAGMCLAIAQPGPADQPVLTLEQKEAFLRKAKVLKIRPIGTGVTESKRATLDDGKLQHDAHLQSVDEFKTSFQSKDGTELNFRDSYRYNIAAYELAKILGISDMIPPSVQRKVSGKTSAITWWVDDILMDEAARTRKKQEPPDTADWNKQMELVRVFDQLIFNTDRNLRNLLITKDWRLVMIDHTRGFRRESRLRHEANLTRCDRQFFEKLCSLNKQELNKKLKPWLIGPEIDGLLGRRDLIVQHFRTAAEKSGDSAVFYDRAVK